MTEDSKKLSDQLKDFVLYVQYHEALFGNPDIYEKAHRALAFTDQIADLEKRLSESDYERNKYSSEYYRMLDDMDEMRELWLGAVERINDE